MDEANLARNYSIKSLSELWQPLDYQQYAPPVFNSIEQFFILIFGNTEYGLRFFPLLCGISILLLFYHFCKKYIALGWQWFPLALLAFSPNFIRYATEVKQYSTDAAVALAIFALTHWFPFERFRKGDILIWLIVGVVAVWLSMPVAFVLTGLGIYWLYTFVKTKNKDLLWMFIPFFAWLISFAIYFLSILNTDAAGQNLKDYHQNSFFPIIPLSTTDWHFFKEILISFFRTSLGPTTLAIAWGVISFLTGGYLLYKNKTGQFWLFLSPILASLFASSLEYYSLIPRLTLFFIPTILLFIGIGTAYILTAAHQYLKPVLIVLLLVILFNKQALNYFVEPLLVDEIKPVMTYIKSKHIKGEQLFVHHNSVPAYTYYTQFAKHKSKYESGGEAFLATWSDKLSFNNKKRVWFIFSYHQDHEINGALSILKKEGKLIDQFRLKGSSCYLFEKFE